MPQLYIAIADSLEHQIEVGVYRAGSRLPSVRSLAEERDCSTSTCVNALHELERRGLVEARPKAGFFVSYRPTDLPLPVMTSASPKPVPVTERGRILRMLEASIDPKIISFGAATPSLELLPTHDLEKASRRVWKQSRRRCTTQIFPPGAIELRHQLSRRLVKAKCVISPEDIVITNGANDAQALALQLLTKPGDVVAVESPTSFGLLNVIEQLGLRALGIPTDPKRGLSIEALELAFQNWDIKACVVIPNFSNPLGTTISVDHKLKLLDLAATYEVPIVEDDVYGEFHADGSRPPAIKSWDTDGWVYYCSSATKTFDPDARIGWLVVPEKMRELACYQQYVRSVSVQTPGQLVLAEYLSTTAVDRYLRQASQLYSDKVGKLAKLVESYFPSNTKISRPSGGFVLWVELPEEIDTTKLMNEALDNGVSFAPGALFSAEGNFQNCLRMNAAVSWTPEVEAAVETLGRLIIAP